LEHCESGIPDSLLKPAIPATNSSLARGFRNDGRKFHNARVSLNNVGDGRGKLGSKFSVLGKKLVLEAGCGHVPVNTGKQSKADSITLALE
jgi:hypothetical protein